MRRDVGWCSVCGRGGARPAPNPCACLLGWLISTGRLPSQDDVSQQPLHPGGAMCDQLESLCCTGEVSLTFRTATALPFTLSCCSPKCLLSSPELLKPKGPTSSPHAHLRPVTSASQPLAPSSSSECAPKRPPLRGIEALARFQCVSSHLSAWPALRQVPQQHPHLVCYPIRQVPSYRVSPDRRLRTVTARHSRSDLQALFSISALLSRVHSQPALV